MSRKTFTAAMIFILAAVFLVAITFTLVSKVGASSILSLVNSSREATLLPPVSTDANLTAAAKAHSLQMQANGQVYHSTNLGAATSGWEAIAEAVGAGPSIDSVYAAFMASPGHKAIIMGNYNYVGIGVEETDTGQVWITLIFMRKNVPQVTTTIEATTIPPVVVVTTTSTTQPPRVTTTPPETTTTTLPPPVVTGTLTGSVCCRDADGNAGWIEGKAEEVNP